MTGYCLVRSKSHPTFYPIRVPKCGRDFAAWLGLVPKQHSTGGRSPLLGISKRGNTYIRTLPRVEMHAAVLTLQPGSADG